MTSCRLWTLCWTSRARLCFGAAELGLHTKWAHGVPQLAQAAVPQTPTVVIVVPVHCLVVRALSCAKPELAVR
jgi:hypothetical protein